MRKLILTVCTVLLGSVALFAQNDELKEVGYDQISNGAFSAKGVAGLRSMSDGEHFSAISGDKNAIVRYRYSDGEAVDTIFSNKGVLPSFPISRYAFSADENLIMLTTAIEPIYRHSYKAENWIYDRAKKSMTQLSSAGKQQVATFSPDGNKAAFVRDNNLYVVDLINSNERQITSDGVFGSIINGLCDWVYEEEYGFDRAYEWSPSSEAIAYYRFDESNVKKYHMPVYNTQLYPDDMSFKYPKAGEENSSVSIRVFNLAAGAYTVIDEVTPTNDGYFPRIEWSGRKDELAIHKVNRLQNHYDLMLYNTALKNLTTVFSEVSERYIDRIDASKVTFLPEFNRFIVMSEADGYRHLYMYDMSGKFLNQLTKGSWEVTSLDGVDLRSRKIYFTAAKNSPIGREPYALTINRRSDVVAMSKLNSAKENRGTYSVSFSKGSKYYTQTYSSTDTPTITTVHSASDGRVLRTIEDNAKLNERVKEYALPTKKFITVKAADGVTDLNAWIMYPIDFDENKEYPLFMTQYSGPGSQSVADRWGVSWEAALLKEGYIVVCVDGRGTGYRGFEFRSCTYRDLGNLEVQDQIAAAKELGSLPYIDADRIGIYGWSYGGFMALNCILKGNDVFAAAISVAPVTTWRYYDTIYTEIYNGLPQDNPEGYDNNSPINFADRLKGKLLLSHGTADDNVHISNAYDMMTALNKAGKDYEMQIFPDRNHGMGRDRDRLMRRSIEFIKANL